MRYSLLLFLMLFACGDNTHINYHMDYTIDELHEICNNKHADGCASWHHKPIESLQPWKIECDIWMATREYYESEWYFNFVLNHERDHCYKFRYHEEKK